MKEIHKNVKVIGFVGRPFSGKDFQAERFAGTHKRVAVVSPGAILRDEGILAHSGFSQQELAEITSTRNSGGNVKNPYIERLMFEAVREEIQKGNDTIILAGWPRRPHQLTALQQWLNKEQKQEGISGDMEIVHFRIGRLKASERRHVRLQAEGREDDKSPKSVRRRHWEFETNVWPMLGVLFLQGKHAIPINARLSKDAVSQQIDAVLEPRIAHKLIQ